MENSENNIAYKIVSQHMLGKDAFSKALGIQLKEIEPGFCVLTCEVRTDMLNGFQIAHGGITYSLADSALAFASNAHNNQCLSVETSISHLRKVKSGDILTAECREKNLSSRFGVYEVMVRDQENNLVALFKGTVFRTGKVWISAD